MNRLKSMEGRVITWHELDPGETAQLHPGPSGEALLRRDPRGRTPPPSP